ncbi:peptidylprolyl isomerase [Tsukamurella soli]|uniref:Peptidylprolyl isomerase n=1 Tax=Tsukamurella soli TaxID=644556 RepID=A0ABP8KDP1_9ACTN
MPSNEERRAAAREKLARQNEQRAAEARKRKVIGISAGAVVVVVLVAAGCYLWLPQGPRGPLRVAAEHRFASTHTNCTFADQPNQVQQVAKAITQGTAQLAKLPADQKPAMELQIKQLTDAQPALQKMADFNKTVAKPNGTDVPNTGTVDGSFDTTAGTVDFTLDRSWAPCNVATVTQLINGKYYDGTQCFRETAADPKAGSKLSVLQCGDRSNSGLGGPSWTSPDEIPTQLKAAPNAQASMAGPTVIYPAGTIAIANTGQPNSGASQFFMVYADTELPASYATVGTVSPAGLKVLQAIAAKGIKPSPYKPAPAKGAAVTDGVPGETVTITKATLS